jgi:2,3-bisphosphoglycerate-dependent phosphoglycerate mutase
MVAMVRLWLVRHGQTDWNAQRRFQGWADVPLNEVGRSQATALRTVLEPLTFDGVWSSDLARAVDTARLAYREPVTDPRLRELDFGDLQGRTWEELSPPVRDALAAFDGFHAPGGESMAEFSDRVHGFVDALPPGDHLVIAHGGVVRLLGRVCGADGFPDHAAVLTLDWSSRARLPGSE